MRALLIRQAERIDHDHWYQAEEGNHPPYYRATGLGAPRGCASGHGPVDDPFWRGVGGCRAALVVNDPLRVTGVPEVVVTDEPRIELNYRIETATGGSPCAGVPFLWTEPVAGLMVENPPPGRRIDARLVEDALGKSILARPTAMTCQLLNPLNGEGDPRSEPVRAATSLVIHGFFRGQTFEFRTKLDLHRAADIVIDHPPRLETAGVALQTEAPVRSRLGTAQGAVAFVVDASGSMGPPEGKAADENTKYAVALKALERAFGELPAGLIVSVYQFGAARPNHAKVEPEQTIETVFGPAPGPPRAPRPSWKNSERPSLGTNRRFCGRSSAPATICSRLATSASSQSWS